MPTVSVIIPTYNRQNYIRECIQSVLDQTLQDFEIIIVDNCSSDNTINVIIGINDPRITLLRNPRNLGASESTNIGIRHAEGKYIAWLGSDDAWYPDKLETQVNYLEGHPEIAAVFSKVDLVNETGNIISFEQYTLKDVFNVHNRTRFEWLRLFFEHGNCLNFPSSLVRNVCFKQLGLFNPALACLVDFDMWIRLCLHCELHVLDQVLVRYRWFSDKSNESADTYDNRVRDRFELLHVLDNFLQLADPREVLLIFPDIAQYGEVSRETIPYFLGRTAIESGLDVKELWGLRSIMTLLQNEHIARMLDKNCRFTFMDFIELVREHDIFKNTLLAECDHTIQALSAQLNQISDELKHSKAEVLRYALSRSWRITRPLRELKRLFERDNGA